jgi:hypothetical protein
LIESNGAFQFDGSNFVECLFDLGTGTHQPHVTAAHEEHLLDVKAEQQIFENVTFPPQNSGQARKIHAHLLVRHAPRLAPQIFPTTHIGIKETDLRNFAKNYTGTFFLPDLSASLRTT